MKKALDTEIKKSGAVNAYFPLFIPNSLFAKEKEHVAGFAPETAVVTIGGGEELADPLIVRPTSEMIMYEAYARWISSWRDLPMVINQWNNVVRWEKRTYLFLRTTEFLWQEGHTAHATFEDADNFARKILEIYRVFDEELLAIPVVIGRKSQSEKFPGAAITYSLESLMPDGKVIQMGTSHHLGDNFARAFNIQYLDKKGERQYVWQTSWAETTRVIGALIMAHGDDQGLVLPPRIAPVQVIIIPISQNSAIARFCDQLKTELEEVGIRVKIDDREEKTVGWKFNEWELKGVPVRIEVGEKEIKSGELTVFRRDKNEKLNIKNENRHLPDKIIKLLDEIQKEMFLKQKKFTEENTHTVNSYEEFKKIMSTTRGFIKAMWCEDALCEKKIKDETKASTRVLPLETKDEKGKCIYCGKQAIHRWLFAQAY